jgi:K+-transporting ATPase ATPase C chain
MNSIFRPSLVMLAMLTVATGVVYPLAVTGFAAVAFPEKAKGSMVIRDGVAVGSELVGQQFTGAGYFHGRPSATAPFPYNAAASSGSNLAPSNPAHVDGVLFRIAALRKENPGETAAIPADLVTASGSGLDPEISPAAAAFQVNRVAAARGLPADVVSRLVLEHTRGRTMGMLGEPGVNVLLLNVALDGKR